MWINDWIYTRNPRRACIPTCVAERIEWAMKTTFITEAKPFGVLKIVMAYGDEEDLIQEFFEYRPDEWLPVSKEFLQWRRTHDRNGQMEIMRALANGYELTDG